ncbi:hypothetical protein Agub_g15510 [Astrephomene gubernaculifera]|uniref:Uncharacterized protein n=1 Tax=Astrephomene gubernaculifera TaxID=47775 RepID=A0AAD3HTS9_9CHLO|nr:hypothetical protein Agub_g15510 [Astrephomene gubernaculifera]
MADTAMASLQTGGAPSPFSAALPIGGLEALKYAAQADAFQDDPNFYSWLEDFIGKQDEETVMVDAFSTLNDFNMQFDEFQQQKLQHQQQLHGEQRQVANSAHVAPSGAPVSDIASIVGTQAASGSNGIHPTAEGFSFSALAASLQRHPQQLQDFFPHRISSSCASMASHPSSHPSDSNSNSNSQNVIGSPSSESADLSSTHQGAKMAADTPVLSSQPQGPQAAAPIAKQARMAAAGDVSAGEQMSLGASLAPGDSGLLADLHNYLRGGAADPKLSLNAPAAAPMHSHGTVSSFVGLPFPGASRPGPAASGAGAQAGPGSCGGNALSSGVPSLDALIARAVCGNRSGRDSNIDRRLTGLASIGLSGCGGGGGRAATAAAGGIAAHLPRNTNTNNSTSPIGSSGDISGSCAEVRALSSGELASGGSGCVEGLQQQHALSSGGGALAKLSHLHRHHPQHPQHHGRGNSSAHVGHQHPHPSLHNHHNTIPVAHQAHVGKLPSSHWGGGRGAGVSAGSGRPTRSARAKAVFAALEAEVAGKMDELEALQREHATLANRVEILEVALERQGVVLALMEGKKSSGAAGGGGGGEEGCDGDAQGAAAAAGNGNKRSAAQAFYTPKLLAAAYAGGSAAAAGAAGAGQPGGPGLGPLALMEAMSAAPGAVDNAELVEWARGCTVEAYKSWYKGSLQALSLALLALEDEPNNPAAEARIVQLVAEGHARTSLVCLFQPLVQLRLKGLNLETDSYDEPSEQHWIEVIKFMSVPWEGVVEMETLFHSYNLLHESFRSELQDTQRDLQQLLESQQGDRLGRHRHCSGEAIHNVMQQVSLLKRVRRILQKIHLLYSCTIGVAAMRILKPKEFAKCCIQSYPYYPCGPSLMKACAQFRVMKALYGLPGCGC